MGHEGSGGSVGRRVRLLHLFHEEHAPSTDEGWQGIGHGDDGGSGGKPRPETTQSVEDEGAGRHGRVVVGEGIGELLLAAAILSDRGRALDELAKLVVEVDRLAGLVGGEELEESEPELARRLVAGEHHVGDVLVDACVEEVEDGVVVGCPGCISGRGGGGAVDVADEIGRASCRERVYVLV